MAGGLSQRLGIDVTVIRIAFVVVTLAGGFGAAAYVVLWLLLPLEGQTESIGARVSRDGQGVLLALAFLPALVATLVVGAALHFAVVTSLAWPCFAGGAGLVLVWRNADPDEREWLRQMATPIAQLATGSKRSRRGLLLRLLLGLGLLEWACRSSPSAIRRRAPSCGPWAVPCWWSWPSSCCSVPGGSA